MSSKSNQVMVCGACAVMMDENAHTTTSIDVLANGVKRLFSKGGRHNASASTARMRA